MAYDAAGGITRIEALGGMDDAYTHDPAGNITAIADGLDPAASRTFTYDPSDRLRTAAGSWGLLEWTYDANGNRLTQSDGFGTEVYSYEANRLISVESPDGVRNCQYSPDGEIIADGLRTFTYNQN